MFRDREKMHNIIGKLDMMISEIKEYKDFFKTMNLDWNKKQHFERTIDCLKEILQYFQDELFIERPIRGRKNG